MKQFDDFVDWLQQRGVLSEQQLFVPFWQQYSSSLLQHIAIVYCIIMSIIVIMAIAYSTWCSYPSINRVLWNLCIPQPYGMYRSRLRRYGGNSSDAWSSGSRRTRDNISRRNRDQLHHQKDQQYKGLNHFYNSTQRKGSSNVSPSAYTPLSLIAEDPCAEYSPSSRGRASDYISPSDESFNEDDFHEALHTLSSDMEIKL